MTLTETFIAGLPFIYFVAIATVTPGPNNMMLTASGMNFGIRRTIPHIAGVVFGCIFVMLLCAFGVGAVLTALPGFKIVLNIFCSAYILYLSYKIATSADPTSGVKKAAKPVTFLQASLFQFVNPKGVVMGLASVSLLPEVSFAMQAALILFLAVAVSIPSATLWTVFGKGISKIFKTERTRRIINIVLAVMLVATIPMMMIK